MRTITATATTTIQDFISANFDGERAQVELGQLNYRNTQRWDAVMPAVVEAMPQLWEAAFGPEWSTLRSRFPYFELTVLDHVYAAVMDGTRLGVEYVVQEWFPENVAHIVRPMLRHMWDGYRV